MGWGKLFFSTQLRQKKDTSALWLWRVSIQWKKLRRPRGARPSPFYYLKKKMSSPLASKPIVYTRENQARSPEYFPQIRCIVTVSLLRQRLHWQPSSVTFKCLITIQSFFFALDSLYHISSLKQEQHTPTPCYITL